MQTKDLAHTRLRHIIFGFLIGLALATPQVMLAADAPPAPQSSANSADGAPIEFWNRQIATMRGTLVGASPSDRAERAVERLDELPLNAKASDITVLPLTLEGQSGVGFIYQGKILFFLGTDDLDQEGGETLAQASGAALQNLDEALEARRAERSWPVIRSGLLFTFVGLALLVFVVTSRSFGHPTASHWRICTAKSIPFLPACVCSVSICYRTSPTSCMRWCVV